MVFSVSRALLLGVTILTASVISRATPSTYELDQGGDPDLGNIEQIAPATLGCLMSSDMCAAATAQTVKMANDASRPVSDPLFNSSGAFGRFKEAYPNGEADEVKSLIGRAMESWIVNTCVIRISYAMNNSGVSALRIDPRRTVGLNTISDRNNVTRGPYAYRVDEFAQYLIARYGRPSFSKSKTDSDIRGDGAAAETEKLRDAFSGKKGIILFVVDKWSDATGHFDIWDESSAVHQDYFAEASHVFIWE